MNRALAWGRTHPIAAATMAGCVLRLLCAVVAPSFHARDDYFHVLEPALQWLHNPAYLWDSGAPGAGIRSHLVPRMVWLLLLGCEHLGIDDPVNRLRIIYAVAGCYSVAVIPGLYFAASRLLNTRAAVCAAWLGALHFAMPYAGTRLLIEGMAMPPLIWGLGLMGPVTGTTPTKRWNYFVGGLLLGFACWLRFQTILAVVGIVMVLLWRVGSTQQRPRALGSLAMLGLGGILTLLVQGLFDQWTTGYFLGPLINNIWVNLCAGPNSVVFACDYVARHGLEANTQLTRSGLFSYVGMWLLLTIPPATLVILPGMWQTAKKAPLLSITFASFVVLHSLLGHKEERFMLPVFPLFLLFLADLPNQIHHSPWASYWPPIRRGLIGIHGAMLLLVIFSFSQYNQRAAMTHLSRDADAHALISLGPEIHRMFLGSLPFKRNSHPNTQWLSDAIADLRRIGHAPNRFMAFVPDGKQVEQALKTQGLRCDAPMHLPGWWADRLLYRLNPKHNRRRAPILIWSCGLR